MYILYIIIDKLLYVMYTLCNILLELLHIQIMRFVK